MMRKARKAFKLSEPVNDEALDRAINRANAAHYTDSLPPLEQYEITMRRVMDGPKHKPSDETMAKFAAKLADDEAIMTPELAKLLKGRKSK